MSTCRKKWTPLDMRHIETIEDIKNLLLSYSALDKSDQGEEKEREGGDQSLSHASATCCQGQSGSRNDDFTSDELSELPVVLLPL